MNTPNPPGAIEHLTKLVEAIQMAAKETSPEQLAEAIWDCIFVADDEKIIKICQEGIAGIGFLLDRRRKGIE